MFGSIVSSRMRHKLFLASSTDDSQASNTAFLSPYLILGCGVGMVTFPSCLGLMQVLVFRPLRLTCALWGASVLGLVSVGLSGTVASTCAMHIFKFNMGIGSSLTSYGILESTLMYGATSSLIFKCLGGRFSSVLPSNLLHPGAFAREGLSASFNYASNKQKRSLRVVGKKYGCHTCGRRRLKTKDFVADHQPPLAVIRERLMTRKTWYDVIFRRRLRELKFYPQCNTCSDTQGVHLRTAFRPGLRVWKWRHIVTHSTALRLYHLYLPLPVLMPYLEGLFVT
ncbi:uncharacterized protein [Asterias amurensis]|uniref:uncharacterized protein n=1 Tax=Asterias amurensis TaxID=7602 RepID=UPI003AB405BD